MDRTQEQAKEVVEENLLFDLSGFIDARSGRRTRHDPNESDFALGEIRARIEAEKTLNDALARLSFDLLYDAVATDHDVDLETGEGWLDLREAFVTTRAAGFLDLKIGRQILTWGTGDLIFINDLFPKDFVSFFIGRHREYLKAPSDSFKASFFSRFLNLDFVYTPRFDPDRIIDGSRISFFSPTSGQLTGRRSVVSVDRPDQWFRDDEIAVRLYRNLGALEVAGYLYRGFWKSPAGNDPARGQSIFPRLTVAGASARGPLMGGIANAEFGFYRSEDDTRGSDPMVRNSELRFLIGFERELWRDLTLGAQYYLERINDYSNYQRSLPAGAPRSDENRHLLTARVTQQLLQQNLELGLFAYWVPSDHDAYLRPRIHYKIDDHWSAEMGGHIFLGRRSHTFFGQFKRNSSLYLAVRFGF
ncbi:MAG: hypothetical protein GY725_00975 [bacterium]|nr:hypothetical protein [bacterium]